LNAASVEELLQQTENTRQQRYIEIFDTEYRTKNLPKYINSSMCITDSVKMQQKTKGGRNTSCRKKFVIEGRLALGVVKLGECAKELHFKCEK
jgi:hypothetical protein